MKNIKYILFTAIAAVMSGCANFDDLNTNPAKSTNMDPELMIPTVQMRISENHQEWARYLSYPGGFMNQWAGYWGTVNYGGLGIKADDYMEQMWISYYPIIIRDVVDIVYRSNGDPSQVNVNSIGRILKVQCFQKLTDYYGDIPYSEAGLGYHEGITTPKYDKQSDIYYDLLKELKEASEALDPAGDMVTNDLYYGGDIAKWKKFANSLRLRTAMRLIKVDPATAKTEAEAAIAAGVFESNGDICFTQHEEYPYGTEGVGKGCGICIRLSDPDNNVDNVFRVSRELVTQLENTGDPRLLYIARSTTPKPTIVDITSTVYAHYGSYAAMALPAQQFNWDEGFWEGSMTFDHNGTEYTLTNGQWRLQPSQYISATAAPYIHMSCAEVKFLMAEAAFRGWNAGGKTASELYTEALEHAVRQWTLFGATVSESALSSFLSGNTLTPGSELLDINTQLWVLHILDPLETWANWRRTGLPNLVFKNINPAVNQTNGTFPRRMEYPLEEQMKNGANYYEALERMGGTDDWLNRVWWDKE